MTGDQPSLTFLKANLTEEEVAAIAAALIAGTREERLHSASDRPLAGGWNSYYRTVRRPLAGGRDAWRTYHRL